MTKLLQNKPIIKFLGIALSILLIVALVPQINIAYGSKDDVLADTGTEETTDPSEAEDAAEQPLADTEGVEVESEGDMPSGGIIDEAPTPDDESGNDDAAAAPMALSEDPNAEAPEDDERALADNSTTPIVIGKTETVRNANGTLNYNRSGSYTLTVDGALTTDIKVTNGAVLTINGKGTINGTKVGSVIVVEGKNDGTKLIFDGPTVKDGTGTLPAKATNWGKVGGGILIARASGWEWGTQGAALEFISGTV